MIWAFGPCPGGTILCAWCDPEEYERIVALGAVTFDGQRARVFLDGCDPDQGFVRFELEQPFRMPPTRLVFEDEQVAAEIAATGWYSLEGTLYRATLGEPGTVVLDRVFHGEPPTVWHGRSWPSDPDVTMGESAMPVMGERRA